MDLDLFQGIHEECVDLGEHPQGEEEGKTQQEGCGNNITRLHMATDVCNSVYLLWIFVTDYFVVKRCFWLVVNGR